MKEIIIFDGDGTLWFPRTTKTKKKPHWIYYSSKTAKDPIKELMLTPTTLSTLRKLKQKGKILVLLSTHLHPPKEADAIIRRKIRHLRLGKYFDEVRATSDFHGSKGELITEILKKRGIPKCKALMVGDSYVWDYKPASDNGIEALLIKTVYDKHPRANRVKRKIKSLKDMFGYL